MGENNDVLVVKMDIRMAPTQLQRIYDSIISQKEKGVVLLPAGCEAIIVPKDIEVRVEDKDE